MTNSYDSSCDDEQVGAADEVFLDADRGESILTEAERQEIDRRLAEHDQNPESAIPWEEVRKRLCDRFS